MIYRGFPKRLSHTQMMMRCEIEKSFDENSIIIHVLAIKMGVNLFV